MKNTSNHLIINVENSSTTDNKHTQNIDKKIKKIAQLKKQIQKITDTIATAKELHSKHCKKKEIALLKSKEEFLIKLYERYQQKGFTNWQKEIMESKLMNDIDALLSSGHESEILLTIHDKISKEQLDNMGDFEKEMINEMAKEFLEDMGVDVDEENFNFEDFKDADFRKQFQKQYSEKEYQKFHEETKNQKHREQHEKVKTTNTDFQKLYKSLVKKVHPDLVTDPTEKEIREEWMKKLSQVWEERNYYQLILLQKEIDANDSMDITLNEFQIQPLIRELNKEIKKLEADKYTLKHHDPETSFYFKNFNARSAKGVLKKVLEHKNFVEFEIDEMEEEKFNLKTQKSTKELLTEIRDSIGGMYENPFESFDLF